jgi:hypothetical protein
LSDNLDRAMTFGDRFEQPLYALTGRGLAPFGCRILACSAGQESMLARGEV